MDQRDLVDWEGNFDLMTATGRSLYRLPTALRDQYGQTKVTSLVAAFGDPWVNPCSGGLVGHAAIAEGMGRELRQVQRTVFGQPVGAAIRWAHGIPASHVSSLADMRKNLDTLVHDAHCAALGITKPSSGGL
jgi:hypothetical protein